MAFSDEDDHGNHIKTVEALDSEDIECPIELEAPRMILQRG